MVGTVASALSNGYSRYSAPCNCWPSRDVSLDHHFYIFSREAGHLDFYVNSLDL